MVNQENLTVKSETDRFKRDYEIAQETIARMATQISSGHANDTDKTEEISKLNKLLLEAATEKDRMDAEVTYLKERFNPDNILKFNPRIQLTL